MQGVSPPPVVLPDDTELARVVDEALSVMRKHAAKNPRHAFTNEELREAVKRAMPHNLYRLYCECRDGTVPRTPAGSDSEIGARLRRLMLDQLDKNAPRG